MIRCDRGVSKLVQLALVGRTSMPNITKSLGRSVGRVRWEGPFIDRSGLAGEVYNLSIGRRDLQVQ